MPTTPSLRKMTDRAQDYSQQHLSGRKSSPEFMNGAAAAFINILVTFPLNKVMFRQQAEGMLFIKAVQSVQDEGWSNLYRGVGPPLLQRTASMAVMFGLYDWYYKLFQRQYSSLGHWPCSTLAAVAAGSTEAVLAPFERIQTLLQHRRYTERFDNMWDTASKLRVYGFREYYRGLSAVLLRNGPSNALFFTLCDPLRDLLPNSSEEQSIARDFMSGALLGASLSTIFYPLNVAKTMMQSRIGGGHVGVVTTIRAVLKERGSWLMLYRGVHLNFSRSLISWGIINSTYEFCRRHNVIGLQEADVTSLAGRRTKLRSGQVLNVHVAKFI
jgi:hypothetical protein